MFSTTWVKRHRWHSWRLSLRMNITNLELAQIILRYFEQIKDFWCQWPWGNLLLWTWWCRYLHGSCFNSRFHRGWKEGGTGELGSFVTVDLFACNFIYFTCTILRPMRFSFCQHCAWQQRQRERERRKEETRREEKRKEGKGREEKRDEERHHCTQTATFFTLSFVLRVAIALPLRCHCVAIALPLLLESSSTKQKKLHDTAEPLDKNPWRFFRLPWGS